MKPEHPYTKVFNPFTKTEINIDEEIAKLIELIWSHGIKTDNSCQNNVPSGYIWIQFSTPDDATKFINLVVTEADDSQGLYTRAFRFNQGDGLWEYNVLPEDLNLGFYPQGEELIEFRRGPPVINFSVGLRFPQRDKELIISKLTRN